MKTKYLSLIGLLFFLSLSTQAQDKYTAEPGKVTQHEMSMESYEEDPEAGAVVIYEIGYTFFQQDDVNGRFLLNTTKTTKIKILDQSGLDYANWEIPFFVESNNNSEMIENLSATTYNFENGQLIKTPLNTKLVYEEKATKNWRVKKFALPNVKVGSVIEVTYTITSPFLFNTQAWEFQKEIPVIYSMFDFKVIPYYEYTYIAKGTNKFDVFEKEELKNTITWGSLKYREVRYRMGMRNIPAFKDQEFIASSKDHMISLHLQLSVFHSPRGGKEQIMTTWPALCTDFLKGDYFGKYLNSAEKEAKKILPAILVDRETSDLEKIRIVTSYVKNNYNWTGIQSKYTDKKLSQILKEKNGNSAELNLLLAGLLKGAGLDAKAILLSTRGNGIINTSYPFAEFLNYVIVQVTVGEEIYFLDATQPMLAFNELPAWCTNVKGLVVEKDSNKWIQIHQDNLALTEKTFLLTPNLDDDLLQAEITYKAYNFDAYNYRRTYYGEESRLKELLQEREISVKGSIEVSNYPEVDKPFSFHFQSEMTLGRTNNKLFIAPFLNQSQTKNIFTQKERILPIDMIHKHAGKYNSRIQIPEGYQIEYIPKAFKMDNKYMLINYAIEQKDDEIIVNAEYQFKESLYEAMDYPALKECFNHMVHSFNDMIILSKL